MDQIELAGKGINGLFNVGNTCYINTSLQCMGHCTMFLKFILSGNFVQKKGIIADELRQVYHALWVDNNGIIPNRFLKYLRQCMSERMEINEQNDMHEFITIFIDKINECVATKLDGSIMLGNMIYADTSYDKLRKKVDKSWFGFVGKEYSQIIDLFYGQNVSQIVCGNCHKIHHNYEPFSVFMVHIPIIDSDLKQCLHHLLSEGYLNDNSGSDEHIEWKCDNCNEKSKSLKTTKFWRLPKVLTVCLKRFTHDHRKNNSFVQIPEMLDLTEYIIGPTPNKKYALRSVGCHIGNFYNGHYYAICKNPNGDWYRMDDTNVMKMNDGFECSNTAYTAFYEST